MSINEYVNLAERLESLIRRTGTYNKSRDRVLEELLFMAQDLRAQADRLDKQMEEELHDDRFYYSPS
jgi:hypothetical protein